MAIHSTTSARSPQHQQLDDERAFPNPPPSHDTPGGALHDAQGGSAHDTPHDTPHHAPHDAPPPTLLSRMPPPLTRGPAAYAGFAGRAAWSERRPPSALDDLPEPAVRAPAPPAPPVTTTPAPAAAPAAPAPPPNPSGGYVGERPVAPQWLQDRESALRAVRADYEAQRTQAQAGNGVGPGWVAATMVTDESGQTRSASGAPTVFIAEPGAQPTVIGHDESGPLYGAAPGRTLEFNDEAFAAHYRAQGSAQLQTLAQLYDTDAATLLAHHPGLWQLATQDHALNAGPPPPGRAMGDPSQLGMLDLYMADPQIAGLINTYGGSVAPPTSGIALEQVRIYGQTRYEQLTRLGQAMQAVRNDYSAAMAQAQSSGAGVGWVERQRTTTVSDESGASRTEPAFLTDESGARTPLIERVFDPDAFTRWYNAQDGQANRAFANFYGQSHTQYSTDESGATRAGTISFDNANWAMHGAGGGMAHRELVSLDPNNAPRLNNNAAVGFDLEAGWATHQSNIHQKRDWFETVVQIAIVGVVSWVSAGTLGAAAASAVGGGVAGAVASAAVVGAAASAASGMMSGNLTFKGILQGALSGALTAGLMGSLGGAVQNVAGTAGTIALRATVQGGIQALLGGKFRDGALAGLASGLAEAAGANLNKGIDDALASGTMTAAEGVAARMSARVLGSAIRALGNPNDPNYAFASAFVDSVVNDGLNAAQPAPGPRVNPPALDDDGNVMPGVVDPAASADQQLAQLTARLEAQGLNPATAAVAAQQALAGPTVATAPPPSPAQTFPIDGPGSRPGPPLNNELFIEGRLTLSTQYDQAGNLIANYSAPETDRYTLTLGSGYGLARGADGGMVMVSAEQAQAQGLAWVAGPGQTVIGGSGGSSGGAGGLWVLPPGASPHMIAAAGSMAVGFGQRAVLGALAEGAAATAGRYLGATLVEDLVAALPRVLGAVGLFIVPGNVGQDATVRNLSDDVRQVTRLSERLGFVEFRVTDAQGNAQWLRMQGQFDPEQAQQLANMVATARTTTLSPEEIARVLAPTTLPIQPPGNTSPPPLPIDNSDARPGTPGYVAAPPAGPNIETLPIEQMRVDDLIIESRGLTPGSEEHRAAAWDLYNQRPNAEWDYARWSSVYEANQNRARDANVAVDQYHADLGWGEREVTVNTTIDGQPSSRRLDIADEATRRAVEYKTGYQSATADNLWEVQRDADLVRRGWQVEWVFKGEASQPLLDALDRAGIKYKKDGG
jgi:hypothetical protein